jgi:hypothetical protein
MKAYEQVKMMKQVITLLFVGIPMFILLLIYSLCIWIFAIMTWVIWHSKTGFYLQYKSVLVEYLPNALVKKLYNSPKN